MYQWFWRLLPANPLLVRVVQGGSRRQTHLWVRMGYLGALILLVVIGLFMGGGLGTQSLTDLAKAGTRIFAVVSYGQVILVCLLAPLFMAGALSEEQSGQTFDILLTTPMSNLQIVLGSLAGRLFFVLALLAGGLPLFSVLLLFGGVPVKAVFVAFAVAALTALVVGSVAVALSVSRKAGRKAVFLFVVIIAAYLLGSYALDHGLRTMQNLGVSTGGGGMTTGGGGFTSGGYRQTTWLTPLHPLLVLESFINTANYRPPSPEELAGSSLLVRLYRGQPLLTFTLLSLGGSAFLVLGGAWRLRSASEQEGNFITRWWRQWLRLDEADGEGEGNGEGKGDGAIRSHRSRRKARTVWHNPIAWQEAHTRANRWPARLGRAMFVLAALLLALGLLLMYHGRMTNPLTGLATSANDLRAGLAVLLWLELLIVVLVAIYMSAGAVSREREDGTLDLLLTTPITPRQYLWGKLRGLVSFLTLLLLAPLGTMLLAGGYTAVGLLFNWQQARTVGLVMGSGGQVQVNHPVILPEAGLLWPVVLVPFVAWCVALGLGMSLKARGVMGAIVPTVGVVGLITVFMGFCGIASAGNVPYVGLFINALSPATSLWMLLSPWELVAGFADSPAVNRVMLVVAMLLVGALFSLLVYSMIQSMVRSFDQTVRKLAGTAN